MAHHETQSLAESMKQLESIVEWFDHQEEVDVEKGLEKFKEGAALVKLSRARLKEIENEFQEIEKELETGE